MGCDDPHQRSCAPFGHGILSQIDILDCVRLMQIMAVSNWVSDPSLGTSHSAPISLPAYLFICYIENILVMLTRIVKEGVLTVWRFERGNTSLITRRKPRQVIDIVQQSSLAFHVYAMMWQ